MVLQHLSLTNFRNYSCLELDLLPGVSVFCGGNAQGKTNLLEAVYFLSTARPVSATAERELVNWSIWREIQSGRRPKAGFCRLSARVGEGGNKMRLEILLRILGGDPPQVRRIIRVNGVVHRALELVGRLRTVMFSPRDIALVGGEPLLRRRWLDILNSQLSSHYLRNLLRYNRVLNHRRSLLKAIAAQRSNPLELSFWDRELVETGSHLILQRKLVLQRLSPLTKAIHRELTGGREELELIYRPSVLRAGGFHDLQEIRQAFERQLEENRKREMAQGVSLIGPHRDDLRFQVSGVDMGTYGSRGQRRTIALSLRLGEAKLMLEVTGRPPVLLLDDVLSELDEERRGQLLESLRDYQQVLITATELDRFPGDFLSRAARFKVEGGRVESFAGATNSAC